MQVVAVAHVAAEVDLGRLRRRRPAGAPTSGRRRFAHQVTAARCAKRGLAVCAAREHVAQLLGGVPGVDEARVERREAEAQQVGARVGRVLRSAARAAAGSPARKSPITPRSISACMIGIALGVREARLAAARGRHRAASRARGRGRRSAPRRDAMKSSASAIDLARSAAMPPSASASREDVEAAFERGHREHGRRAADEARDAARRPIRRRELERRRVAEPARERLAQLLAVHARGVARMRPHERGSARAAVQVLVAAADRRSRRRRRAGRRGTAPAECARSQTTSAPAACAARVVSAMRVHAAAAVVDVGQHQHGDVARRDARRCSAPSTRRSVRPAAAATLSAM